MAHTQSLLPHNLQPTPLMGMSHTMPHWNWEKHMHILRALKYSTTLLGPLFPLPARKSSKGSHGSWSHGKARMLPASGFKLLGSPNRTCSYEIYVQENSDFFLFFLCILPLKYRRECLWVFKNPIAYREPILHFITRFGT